MVLICPIRASSPKASIFSGVSAIWNSARVALFTPLSVACADSATATSRVKAFRCSNSPFGSASASRNRVKRAFMAGYSSCLTMGRFQHKPRSATRRRKREGA